MIKRTTLCLVFIVVSVWNGLLIPALAKPPHDGHSEEGPCVDCLHGVLMHDDEEQGIDHAAEDQYLRFKDVLQTGTDNIGPITADKEYHGVLMHGDTEAGHHHEEEIDMMPENRQEALPKDINQELHESMHGREGVDKHDWDIKQDIDEDINNDAGDYEKVMHGLVMHGDFNSRKDMHASDDIETTEQEGLNRDAGDHEKVMHNLLMHGDFHGEAQDHNENDEGVEEAGNRNAGDHQKVMHGLLMHGDINAEDHDHDAANDESDIGINRNAGDHEKVMHGLLMHGDIHESRHGHATDDLDKTDINMNEDTGDHEKIMHGLLMHGDPNFKGHENEELEVKMGDASPQTAEEYLHGVLMHGDSKPGEHHGHEKPDDDVSDDKSRGPSTEQLHGVLMHGDSQMGHDHASDHAAVKHEVFRDLSKIIEMGLDDELLKVINLEKILRQDIEEYADWKVNNPKHEDTKSTGSTYLDASLLKDIEMMKQRYLNRDDKVESSVADGYDDIPFTAEDANSVLSDSAKNGEGEDMRHDLELAGSTDPINSRHKIKMELLQAKEKK